MYRLLSLLFCTSAFASTSLTLDAALQTAMDHSPQLQKAEAAKEEGKWRGIEGLALLLPTVNFTANHFIDRKFQILNTTSNGNPIQIEQIFPTSNAMIEAKWTLFDGFSNVSQYQGAKKLQQAARENYEWTRFQLERDTTLAYQKVVAAKKLEGASEQNLKTLENHLDQVKKLQIGGLATHYDVLRVESQVSEGEADLLQAKDNTIIAEERLGQNLGLSEAVQATDTELVQPTTDKIKTLTFNQANEKRLDLSALQNQVEASDHFDSGNQLFWVPRIGLGAQYIKYNNLTRPVSDWDNYRTAWNTGIFLTWTLFSAKEYSQAKQISYRAIQSQKALLQTTLQAPIDFAFWKKRYLYSAQLFQAKKVDLERANETVRLASEGFKAGVRTTTEVLDAELELFRARAGIINAQMNCIEAKIKLELSVGEKI